MSERKERMCGLLGAHVRVCVRARGACVSFSFSSDHWFLSTHPTSVLTWLKAFADARSLPWRQDAVGNILIQRPGCGGGEHAPPVAVQGHVDMVTECRRTPPHDFTTTGITLVIEGDVVRGDGTTLGADNGIGVAAALALLDAPASTPLPPLQALFTVDEETGLTGAFGLDAAALGLTAKACVNLDTEDWGEIFIGCAGGGDTVVSLPVEREPLSSSSHQLLLFSISGLAGGHSGLAIGDDRGNALRLCGRLAAAAAEAVPGLRVVTAAGGDKRNAIPRDCVIVASAPTTDVAAALAAASSESASLSAEYGVGGVHGTAQVAGAEPGLAAVAAAVEPTDPRLPPSTPTLAPLTSSSSTALLTLLTALPHGVVKMSAAVPGLVETSTNLASVKPTPDGHTFTLQTSTRSSHGPALEAVRRSIRAVAAAVGASSTFDEAYPGWAPAPSSPLLELTLASVAKVLGRPPATKCIHAGLECGILGGKMGGGGGHGQFWAGHQGGAHARRARDDLDGGPLLGGAAGLDGHAGGSQGGVKGGRCVLKKKRKRSPTVFANTN